MKVPVTLTWHATPTDDVLGALTSSPDGLPSGDAERRLAEWGPNVLRLASPISAWRVLLAQFRSVVVILLAIAAGVAWLTADAVDAMAIGAVLVVNAAIGFVTEIRARRAIESLTTLTPRRANVVRPGQRTPDEVDAASLVPGDVIVVEAGGAVPADARLIREAGLRVNESLLTGESVPATKTSSVLAADTPLADRENMIYTGTTVLAPSRIVANPWALGAVGLVIGLQLMTLYVPALQAMLRTVPLDAGVWVVVVVCAGIPAVIGQGWRRWTS